MSLIAEDGTGVASAEVYNTLTEFRAYRPRGGLALPAGLSDALTEAALVRGTSFIEGFYARRWPGTRDVEGQGLAFPRVGAWDYDGFAITGVPTGVKYVCMEAGIIEAITPGVLTESLERGGMVIRKKTGPLEKEFANGAPVGTVYPIFGQLLAGIVRGNSVRVSR